MTEHSTGLIVPASSIHGTTETRFLWQGYRLLQEQHEGGQCSTYLYDPNEAWSPLARIDHLCDDRRVEIYWFSTDLNGAPLEVTDVHGNVRWSGHYGSFGEVRHQTAGFTGALQHTTLSHQPLRYAGQYADSETGLHYNLFRYYDPQVGRFIVQDPIGLNGGWNLYQYAPNPLGWIDPWGLSKCPGVTRGANGEILSAQVTISPSDLRTGTGVNASARYAARALGNQTDDAGHILGKVLGGQGGKGNVFPQLPAINRGGYRIFEKSVKDYVTQYGAVDINWTFVYKNGGARPTDIIYDVSQNGKTVLYSVFGN